MSPQPTDSAVAVAVAPSRVTDFPTPRRHFERSPQALVQQTRVHVWRLVASWMHNPAATIQTLIYPALTLLMLWIVLGKSVSGVTGHSSLVGTVPLMALVASMTGSLTGGVTLMRERDNGLLTRFAVLPNHRAAGFAGRQVAEGIRTLITTVVMVLIGVAIGFRFHAGVAAAVGFFLVPLLFGVGYSTMVTAFAVRSRRGTVVEVFSLLVSLLLFFNTGFVPLFAYPGWLQPIVANQPITCAVETMQGLAVGGTLLEPFLKTLAWSLGAALVFALPAARGYRRAATSR